MRIDSLSRLLPTIAREIESPLAGIRSLIEALSKRASGRRLQAELQAILTEVERLQVVADSLSLADADFLETSREVSMDDLQAHVLDKLAVVEPQAFSGVFDLADYLQLACLGRHSVALKIATEASPQGVVEIVDGDAWTAGCGELRGEEALAVLLDGRVTEVSATVLESKPENRQIQSRMEQILLERARRRDESRLRGEPDPDRPDRASPARRPGEYHRALIEGVKAGLAGNLPKAREAFELALKIRPGDSRAEFNLRRIRRLAEGGAED